MAGARSSVTSATETADVSHIPFIADASCVTPLSTMARLSAGDLSSNSKMSGPFGRIFLFISADQIDFVREIMEKVNGINTKALFDNENNKDSLSQYRLTPQERQNQDLDFLSGYQIMDQKHRIIMVEGLKNLGLKQLADFISVYNPDIFILALI